MSDQRKLLKGMFFNYLNAPIMLLVSICQSAFAIRFLEPATAGICLLLIGLSSFLSICDFGVSNVLSRELSFIDHDQHKTNRKNLFLNAALLVNRRLSLGVLFIGGIALLFYLHSIGSLLNQKTLAVNAIIFILAFGFRLLSNPYMAVLYGLKRVDLQKILNIVTNILGLLALSVLLFVFSFKSFYAFSIAIFLQYLCLFIGSKWMAAQLFSMRKKVHSKLHGQFLLASSLKVFLISLGTYLLFQINPPIIAYYLGPAKLVEFMPIFQILTSAMALCFLMQGAYAPFISSKFSQNGFTAIHRASLFFLKLNMGLIIMVVIYLNFLGEDFFKIWLGHSYVLNRPLLIMLSIMIVLETQHVTLASIVMNCGYVAFIRPALCAGGLNILFLIIFLPRLGIEGAGLSIMLAQLLTNNWFAVYKSIQIMHLNLKLFFIYVVRLSLLSICLSLLAIVFDNMVYATHLLPILILKVVLFLVISSILMIYILLSSGERAKVLKILQKKQ